MIIYIISINTNNFKMDFVNFVEDNIETLLELFDMVKELNPDITFNEFCRFVYNNTY